MTEIKMSYNNDYNCRIKIELCHDKENILISLITSLNDMCIISAVLYMYRDIVVNHISLSLIENDSEYIGEIESIFNSLLFK